MMLHKKHRTIALVVGSASLAVLACTCGALSGLTQVAQQAEAVSTQAVAASTQAVDVATQVADGEIPSPEELPLGALGTDIDACALVTEEEAIAVIGGPLRETVSGPGACFREGENSREVSVVVIAPGSEEAAQAMFAVAKQTDAEADGYEELSGPWAEGFWELDGSGAVVFRQAGYMVLVSTDNPTVYDDAKQQSIQLAELVSSRLP